MAAWRPEPINRPSGLEIVGEALAEEGATFDHVIGTRTFVTDIALFDDVTRAHGEVFGTIRPAPALVEVRRLVEPAHVLEIEVDAVYRAIQMWPPAANANVPEFTL